MRQIVSRTELLALPPGVIVTLYGGWTGEYGSKLHRSGCWHVSKDRPPHRTSGGGRRLKSFGIGWRLTTYGLTLNAPTA